jgi:hypothetical protein
VDSSAADTGPAISTKKAAARKRRRPMKQLERKRVTPKPSMHLEHDAEKWEAVFGQHHALK